MYDFTTSVSNAQPAVSRAGEGDFVVTGGAAKSHVWIWAVLGVAALGITWLLTRR